MTKLCNSCEYLKFCARSGIEDVGCDRYKRDMTTNEEWFCNLSTEEKARFLHDIQFSCNTCTLTSFRFYKSNIMKCPLQVSCAKENGIVEWLKQPHTVKE